MTDKAYTVKRSAIHGKGLFAARRIKCGELIGQVRFNPVTEDGPYVLWLDDQTGVKVDCDLKYINHSARPNACYCEDLDVVALKDIKAGEEITHDYGDDWE
jgi:SET domain-containing protein